METDSVMHTSCLATVDLGVSWQGPIASHSDWCRFERVSLPCDVFPGALGERLRQAAEHWITETFPADDLVPAWQPAQVHAVPNHRLVHPFGPGRAIEPRRGRFYPRQFIDGTTGVYPQDREAFRCLGVQGKCVEADLNHPLSGVPLTISARLVEATDQKQEWGGRCTDLVQDMTRDGLGMQCRHRQIDTDFLVDGAFARDDEADDVEFYRLARFVDHLDQAAIREVSRVYQRFLTPGMCVLDLMSSWHSHLPDNVGDLQVTGIGLNEAELMANQRLTDVVVHDLNAEPTLPFGADAFDVVVCTVSVEYLTQPLEVFREVRRVLIDGGVFVCTFSDRWFPPKVVKIWTELHPFERMGLVTQYFHKAGGFTDLGTESMRGLPRSQSDKYAHLLPFCDPVFAVWGHANSESNEGK